jgi:hypothetical protein
LDGFEISKFRSSFNILKGITIGNEEWQLHSAKRFAISLLSLYYKSIFLT